MLAAARARAGAMNARDKIYVLLDLSRVSHDQIGVKEVSANCDPWRDLSRGYCARIAALNVRQPLKRKQPSEKRYSDFCTVLHWLR